MLTAILALASAAHAAGPPPDLAAASAAWDAAQVKGDRAAIERLLAPDYTLVNSGGKLEDKAQFTADLTDPQFHLAPFTVEAPVVKIWPNGAVLGGIVEEKGSDHGKAFDARIRFADVWAKRDGRWRLVYTHVSKP